MSNTVRIITGTVGSIGAATEIVLQVDNVMRLCQIKHIMVQWNSGTGANYTPSIGNVTGFSTGTIDEKYLGTGVAVATLTDDAEINSFCKTDANGKLYLVCTPDAGADNSFTYSVALMVW